MHYWAVIAAVAIAAVAAWLVPGLFRRLIAPQFTQSPLIAIDAGLVARISLFMGVVFPKTGTHFWVTRSIQVNVFSREIAIHSSNVSNKASKLVFEVAAIGGTKSAFRFGNSLTP